MTELRFIRLLIAFDGSEFSGWQRQKNDRTIQGEIEKCLARMGDVGETLHGAGRTDAGVHAEGMVAHFSTAGRISCEAYLKGLNSMLPPAIRIMAAEHATADFHSRFSARGKRYAYTFFTGKVMPPGQRLYALHVPYDLDFSPIRECLTLLHGRHDFSSFENSGSRDKTNASGRGAVRTISEARLDSNGSHQHIFTFVGDGFLRHMVRNLVGTLLEVGRGLRTPDEFERCLAARDRTAGGPTAPPQGLTLKEVLY